MPRSADCPHAALRLGPTEHVAHSADALEHAVQTPAEIAGRGWPPPPRYLRLGSSLNVSSQLAPDKHFMARCLAHASGFACRAAFAVYMCCSQPSSGSSFQLTSGMPGNTHTRHMQHACGWTGVRAAQGGRQAARAGRGTAGGGRRMRRRGLVSGGAGKWRVPDDGLQVALQPTLHQRRQTQ